MAKPTRFHVGTSGSSKHTEMVGTGEGMGNGPGARPSEMGPRIGAGVLGKRVTPEYDRDAGGRTDDRPNVRGMRRYSEE